jgi:hypothetical protein
VRSMTWRSIRPQNLERCRCCCSRRPTAGACVQKGRVWCKSACLFD